MWIRGQGTLGTFRTRTNSRYALKSSREARATTWLPTWLGTWIYLVWMCCQSTTDGNVTQAAKSSKESTFFASAQPLRLSGNALFGVRRRTATKLGANPAHPFEIEDEVEQMLVRLRSAAAFPRIRHDSRHPKRDVEESARSGSSNPSWALL